SNPVFLSVVFFIVIHSLIGHKEERFMFPVFNIMPLIYGWSVPYLQEYYNRSKAWIKALLRFMIWFTVVLNCILLLAITFVPYSQTIRFSEKLKDKFHNKPVQLYTLGQTPFQNQSRK